MRIATLFVIALVAVPAGTRADAVVTPAPAKPLVQSIAGDVRADELRTTIAKLVG